MNNETLLVNQLYDLPATNLSKKVCPICGKEFQITCDAHVWAYRAFDQRTGNRLLFCKWSCLRKYQKRRDIMNLKGVNLFVRLDKVLKIVDKEISKLDYKSMTENEAVLDELYLIRDKLAKLGSAEEDSESNK